MEADIKDESFQKIMVDSPVVNVPLFLFGWISYQSGEIRWYDAELHDIRPTALYQEFYKSWILALYSANGLPVGILLKHLASGNISRTEYVEIYLKLNEAFVNKQPLLV